MNKKANTLLFILGATVFNLLTMAVLFIVPLVVLLLIFKESLGNFFAVLSLLLFFGALVGTFFIYGWVMKKIQAKIDMDKYFDPIFKKKKE